MEEQSTSPRRSPSPHVRQNEGVCFLPIVWFSLDSHNSNHAPNCGHYKTLSDANVNDDNLTLGENGRNTDDHNNGGEGTVGNSAPSNYKGSVDYRDSTSCPRGVGESLCSLRPVLRHHGTRLENALVTEPVSINDIVVDALSVSTLAV